MSGRGSDAPRRTLTPREKLKVMKRQGWRCGCGCGGAVWPGCRCIWDHILPRALYGTEQLANFQCLLAWCDKVKTKADRARIDKADRQHRAHTEGRGKARKGRPLTDPRYRRKVNGETVRR